MIIYANLNIFLIIVILFYTLFDILDFRRSSFYLCKIYCYKMYFWYFIIWLYQIYNIIIINLIIQKYFVLQVKVFNSNLCVQTSASLWFIWITIGCYDTNESNDEHLGDNTACTIATSYKTSSQDNCSFLQWRFEIDSSSIDERHQSDQFWFWQMCCRLR